jgi:hypothetical protein
LIASRRRLLSSRSNPRVGSNDFSFEQEALSSRIVATARRSRMISALPSWSVPARTFFEDGRG